MRCQDCGKEMKKNAKFCIQCGYPVLKNEAETKVDKNIETLKGRR